MIKRAVFREDMRGSHVPLQNSIGFGLAAGRTCANDITCD